MLELFAFPTRLFLSHQHFWKSRRLGKLGHFSASPT